MIRCSCHGLQGCVPHAARAMPRFCASSSSCARRSPILTAASAKLAQRPVRISTSEAISSPTRCSSSGVPLAVAWSSSKRFVSSSVSGSRTANSSSTATVKSSPFSYASCAKRTCSSGLNFWVSPTGPITLVGEGLEKPLGHPLPAPALKNGAAGRRGEGIPLVLREREHGRKLRGQIARVAGLEAHKVAMLRWVLGLEALGDLGEARVARNERKRASGRRLGGDHAERLREDRGHDAHLAERDQVNEVPVLERPSEERPPGSHPLQLLAVVAEADDQSPCLRPSLTQRIEEDVDALVVEKLSKVEDGRLVTSEPGMEALRVPVVGQPLL